MCPEGACELAAVQMLEAALDQSAATTSAVDLAVGTLQHLPIMEAFIERGVRPSALALRRGAADTPILRCDVLLLAFFCSAQALSCARWVVWGDG